MGAGHTNT